MANADAVEVLAYVAMMADELRALAGAVASEKLLSLLEASGDAAREQIEQITSSGSKSE